MDVLALSGSCMSPVLMDLGKAPVFFTDSRILRKPKPKPIDEDTDEKPHAENHIRHQSLRWARKFPVIIAKTGIEVAHPADFIPTKVNVLDIGAVHHRKPPLVGAVTKIDIIAEKKVLLIETAYDSPIVRGRHQE